MSRNLGVTREHYPKLKMQFLELVGCEFDADHDVVTWTVVDDTAAEPQAVNPPPTTFSTGEQPLYWLHSSARDAP